MIESIGLPSPTDEAGERRVVIKHMKKTIKGKKNGPSQFGSGQKMELQRWWRKENDAGGVQEYYTTDRPTRSTDCDDVDHFYMEINTKRGGWWWMLDTKRGPTTTTTHLVVCGRRYSSHHKAPTS